MRQDQGNASDRALESRRFFSGLAASVLAACFFALEVGAQGGGHGASSDLECSSLGGYPTFTADVTPGPCTWYWNFSGNSLQSDSCGPGSPWGCSSGTAALAGTWAAGMHIRALGHAYNNLCPRAALCVSSITGAGDLFLMYTGDPLLMCQPRVRVKWNPKWNFAMAVDPPAAAVVAGGMTGETDATGVIVKAVDGASLDSLGTPMPIHLGPISIPVSFAGKEGHFVRQVADNKTGDAATEGEMIDWLGAVHVQVRSEMSFFNWSSESELRVCRSDPGLTVEAYCSQCDGRLVLRYSTR